ncbi:MAG: PASTA domain-containing protein, partial [Chitinophagaceae bacterium]|nr:PASTA domain-containing protein [Chitinophagaceae bacterium]
ADGAILEQLYKGKAIMAGDMIPQGSSITLVIGDGLGNVSFDVPDVMGMSYPEAIAVLNASGLQFIDLWDGGITDSQSAVVYYQSPTAKNSMGGSNQVKEGDLVDIRVKQGGKTGVLQQGNKKPGKKVNSGGDDNNGDWD